jgi:hypothetical protein
MMDERQSFRFNAWTQVLPGIFIAVLSALITTLLLSILSI